MFPTRILLQTARYRKSWTAIRLITNQPSSGKSCTEPMWGPPTPTRYLDKGQIRRYARQDAPAFSV